MTPEICPSSKSRNSFMKPSRNCTTLFSSEISLSKIALNIPLQNSFRNFSDIPSETSPGNFYRYASNNSSRISIGNPP